MRLTIISSDNAVYVNGGCHSPLDLSGCKIPSNARALQWFETKGWIEFGDDGDPFTPIPPNEIIDALPDWALACVQAWENYVPPIVEEVVIE